MDTIEVFSIEAIEAAKNGLEADLSVLQKLEGEAVEGARQLNNKESRKTYSAEYLDAKSGELRKTILEKVKGVSEPALEHADKLIPQERHWTLDGILRRSRLTNPLPPVEIGEAGYTLESEKALAAGFNTQREILSDLAENTARTQLLTELSCMDNSAFVNSLEDAKQAGNPALIWMHTLALGRRAYSNGDEQEHLRAECAKAKFSINYPERERAGEALETAKRLRHEISTLTQALTGSPNDQRPWLKRILDHAEHNKTVSRYRRTKDK